VLRERWSVAGEEVWVGCWKKRLEWDEGLYRMSLLDVVGNFLGEIGWWAEKSYCEGVALCRSLIGCMVVGLREILSYEISRALGCGFFDEG